MAPLGATGLALVTQAEFHLLEDALTQGCVKAQGSALSVCVRLCGCEGPHSGAVLDPAGRGHVLKCGRLSEAVLGPCPGGSFCGGLGCGPEPGPFTFTHQILLLLKRSAAPRAS